MPNLSKEEILSRGGQLPSEQVLVPELGGEVTVRGLRGFERDAFETSLVAGEGKDRKSDTTNVRARLVVKCVVDAEGKRMFTDEEAGELGQIRGDALDRMFEVAQRLSGLQANAVEKAAKN